MSEFVAVKLGDFTFMNMEVPPKIPLGGKHLLAVHNLVGGTRIIDAMGGIPNNLEWSGIFFGVTAHDRAKYIDMLRLKGQALPLKWSSVDLTVIIEEFVYDYEFETRMPYKITCVVIRNNATPSASFSEATGFDNNIIEALDDAEAAVFNTEDNEDVSDLADPVNPVSTVSKIQTLKDTINNINGIMKATVAQINDIKAQVQDIQAQVTRQIASCSNFLQTVTTLGGVLPNNPVSISAANLSRSVVTTNNSLQLTNIKYAMTSLNGTVSRVVPTSMVDRTISKQNNLFPLPTTQVIQSANLFQLASLYYGNAMKWTLIAQANSLSSPYVVTPMTLTIPVDSNSTGGVLNA